MDEASFGGLPNRLDTDMKLTVVTATRNAITAGCREALVRCVESVAALKTPHEHLVYDGASTDGTAELLRQLEITTSGLTVVSEPDTGIYNALNKGVRDAKGEWFYVLGCDDYIAFPETMDELLAHHDCDEIVTTVVLPRGERTITLERIFWSTPYNHQGTIMKTAAVRSFGGFDESYPICADFDLMLKFHKAAKRILLSDARFAFFGDAGVSSTLLENTRSDHARVAARHYGSSAEKIGKMRLDGCPDLKIVLPYLFHPDYALHHHARKYLLKNLVWPLVLLRRKIRSGLRLVKHKRLR